MLYGRVVMSDSSDSTATTTAGPGLAATAAQAEAIAAMVRIGVEDEIARRLAPGQYLSLSQATGLSRQHIANVLKGRGSEAEGGISLFAAARLAAAADITIDQVYAFVAGAMMKRMKRSTLPSPTKHKRGPRRVGRARQRQRQRGARKR